MKKINIFNRNTNSPSYRGTGPRKNVPSFRGNAESPRCCRELVCGKTDGIPLFSGMTKKICHKFPSREGWRVAPAGVWFAALVALFVATPSFATDPTPEEQAALSLAKKTVASKAYVDTKQDIIPAGTYGANNSVVTYDSTSGDIQERWIYGEGLELYGNYLDIVITQLSNNNLAMLEDEEVNGRELTLSEIQNSVMPTKYIGLALAKKQRIIPYTLSQYTYNSTDRPTADGSVVVTTGATGTVDQRGIATAPTYDNSNQLTNGNWLPTMSALVNQISAAVDKLTWTATETTATQKYSTTFDGTTNNWPAADANKLVDGTALANGLAQKQNKMVCAGWDSETHTDEHCWLWSIE